MNTYVKLLPRNAVHLKQNRKESPAISLKSQILSVHAIRTVLPGVWKRNILVPSGKKLSAAVNKNVLLEKERKMIRMGENEISR
jgi:hypothetical protein